MSSGRYQSRLFNLFSRQSRRWSDRAALAWRQTRVAVAWSAQILLYPVYAAYQTTRLLSRQIGQTVQRVMPRLRGTEPPDNVAVSNAISNMTVDDELPQITADLPILQLLEAIRDIVPLAIAPAPSRLALAATAQITTTGRADLAIDEVGTIAIRTDSFDSAIATDAQAQPLQSMQVRGIASLLENRKLVLTTVQNQILDILTPQQQMQIQQRIVWELASYCRSQRLVLRQQLAALLPPLPADQPHLLPPVRVLRRLMAWVQTSPVAIAANLFREADLMAIPSVPSILLSELPPLGRSRWWAGQAWTGQPGQPIFSRWQPAATPSSDRKLLPAGVPLPSLVSHWQRWLDRTLSTLLPSRSQGKSVITADLPAPPSAAVVLASPDRLAKRSQPQPVNTTLLERMGQRWRDQTPAIGRRPIPVTGGATTALPPAEYRPLVKIKPASDRMTTSDRVTTTVEPGANPSSESATEVEGDRAIAVAADNHHAPTAAPAWIETQATLVGYVKHPLEHLLEWLDSGMLWLEKAGIAILRWLRRG